MSSLKQANPRQQKHNGLLPHGSQEWFIWPKHRELLYGMIAEDFQRLTGTQLKDYRDVPHVLHRYRSVRSANWKESRDNEPLKRRGSNTPLFPEKIDNPVLLYAYTCKLPSYEGRLIKFGITGEDIDSYIKKQWRVAPKLLATRPGTQAQELVIKNNWAHRRHTRREWFMACDQMIRELRVYWWIVPQFEERVKELGL